MADLSYSPAIRNARLAVVRDALDAGSGGATMAFYTAPQPSAGAAITTQTHLGDCAMSNPCGSVADQALTFDTIADGNGIATGDAAWCRVSQGGTWVMDMRVSDATGTAPVKIGDSGTPSTKIYQGGIIRVLSASITAGNA